DPVGGNPDAGGLALTLNDGGVFSNDGILQLENDETLSGFTNDTDSGTVLLTPDTDDTGLVAGNTYHDLIINNGTFAHWPLDNTGAEVSGMGRTLTSHGSPGFVTDVAPTNYANSHAAELDGTEDYFEFTSGSLNNIATWCAWVY